MASQNKAGRTRMTEREMFEDMGIDVGRRNPVPRKVTKIEYDKLEGFLDKIKYSTKYDDGKFEYRHVEMPMAMFKAIPAEYHDAASGTLKLLHEMEWRGMGIQQSPGWEHYEVHQPEPHILLFKRYIVPPELE